jgi:hypothetical protein
MAELSRTVPAAEGARVSLGYDVACGLEDVFKVVVYDRECASGDLDDGSTLSVRGIDG